MILVIGIDGYSWEWRHWLEADGFHTGPLDSPHALSGPGWTSIFTGLTAEGHGVMHTPVPEMLEQGKRPAYIWDHLAAADMETVAVNVPFSYPPGLVRRLLVCGYPCPATKRTFPRRAEGGWPRTDLDLYYIHDGASPSDFLAVPDEQMIEACRTARWALAHRFLVELQKGHPDLAILCLTDLDRLAHYAYRSFREHATLEAVIADIRLLVRRLEMTLYPDWIFVVSDHGLDLSGDPREGDGWGLCHGPQLPQTRRGIIGWKGQQALAAADIEATVEDVTPTLLYLLDATPRFPIEGTALTEIIKGGRPDPGETRRQLEAIGYV